MSVGLADFRTRLLDLVKAFADFRAVAEFGGKIGDFSSFLAELGLSVSDFRGSSIGVSAADAD